MKKIYNIWMLMCFLALSSCYEEETVIPTHSGNTGSSSSDFIHLPVFPFWIFGKMDKCSLLNGANEIPA